MPEKETTIIQPVFIHILIHLKSLELQSFKLSTPRDFTKLCEKYGYSLVYCNKNGVNCFFIHNDIIKNKNLDFKGMGDITQIYRHADYSSGPNGGHPADPKNRKYVTFDEAIDV